MDPARPSGSEDPWRTWARFRSVALITAPMAFLALVLPPGPLTRSALVAAVLVAWMFGLSLAVIWPPRTRAAHEGGGIVLRYARWRAGLGSLLLPLGIPVAALRWEGAERAIGLVVYVAAAVLFGRLFSTVIHVSPAGLAQTRGVGRKSKLQWDEIEAVVPTARLAPRLAGRIAGATTGVLIYFGKAWPLKVPGGLDGYPEFLALMLARAPPSGLQSLTSAERDQLEAIARLGGRGAFISGSA